MRMPAGLGAVVLAVALCLAPITLAAAEPSAIRSMGYRLQLDGPRDEIVAELARAPHDLIVIDFSPTGRARERFTRAEVARIARGPTGRRLVAAYISIGEASEFRDPPVWRRHWTSTGRARGEKSGTAPDWLGPINPRWPESRKVRFWHPDWQRRLFNRERTGWLDRIVAQGFDAAYLDIVLAYHYWHSHEKRDVRQMARAMMRLVVAMTAHARAVNPDFFTIPQNGAWILNDAGVADAAPGTPEHDLRRNFLDAIGAFAAEDVYFRGPAQENNRFAPDRGTIERLRRDFACNGKPVLIVDYVNEPAKVARLARRAAADGFVACAAPDRGLTRICPPPAAAPRPKC